MLTTATMPSSPLPLFEGWLNDARAHEQIAEPTAMSLATADADGNVSCRIVLLKDYHANGFTFFTNHDTSRKSHDIRSNPKAALCFYWMPLDRQVRIEGLVSKVDDEQADAYFASRARGSQIGAWASAQTQPLDARGTLEERIQAYELQFAGKEVPRPAHWHGWRVVPQVMEFWHQKDFRLHDRFIYTKQDDDSWALQRLNP